MQPVSADQTSPAWPSNGLLSGVGPSDGAATLLKVSSPGRSPQIDPSQTSVFQPGPDGKLHPIPGWRTTGPFDFKTWSHNIDWPGVGHDFHDIGEGVLSLVGLGEAAPFLDAIAPNLDAITANAIQEAFERHHPHPMFMGGRRQQDLVRLQKIVHGELHQTLSKELREAGFPPVGGKSGSTEAWLEHFTKNPESRDHAIDILRKVTKDIDRKHGTSISPVLERELNIVKNSGSAAQHNTLNESSRVK